MKYAMSLSYVTRHPYSGPDHFFVLNSQNGLHLNIPNLPLLYINLHCEISFIIDSRKVRNKQYLLGLRIEIQRGRRREMASTKAKELVSSNSVVVFRLHSLSLSTFTSFFMVCVCNLFSNLQLQQDLLPFLRQCEEVVGSVGSKIPGCGAGYSE